MNLILKRNEVGPDGVFGTLRDENGNLIAKTLEHAFGDDQTGYRSIIPIGTYQCIRGDHKLHGMDDDFTTYEISGVAGHTGLLFHWGNLNKDSEGCVLLGEDAIRAPEGHMLTKSRITFAKFMGFQDGCDSFTLVVV